MRIAFVWFGITGRYGHWKDGLWSAMKHIEKEHEVKYFEPSDDIESFNPDVVLFWEAPCTINGKDAAMYKRVQNLPFKKALLFAGGPVKKEWVKGFDLVFVESKINKEEFDAMGVPNMTAFGINEEIFKPKPLHKIYDGIHHGTCAGWKRQHLVGEALREKGLVVGRRQETDTFGFDRCKEMKCTVMDEKTPEEVCDLINKSHCLVQTSAFWGGGQRATLEAMACNVPVVAMTDSPKNREYVEESNFGCIVEPDPNKIKIAVDTFKNVAIIATGRDYILSKWTGKYYAESLLKGINHITK